MVIELLNWATRMETITADQGQEFAFYQTNAQNLAVELFFVYPYASWERDTNENTNGLIR